MTKTITYQQRRIAIALAASIAVHLLLLVFIGLTEHEKPLQKKASPQIMDVVLLDDDKKKNHKQPKEAKTLSNRNATGGNKQAIDRITRKAKAPVTGRQQQAKPRPAQQPKVAKKAPPKPTEMLARQTPQPQAEPRPVHRTRPVKPKPKPKKQPVKQVPLSNLMPSAMALSELSRDFQRERRMKQKLSREADIPINTKQAKYAPYAQSLVRALEEQWRPGQASYEKYPDEARRSLIKLTIEHDGQLAAVEILHPSPLAQINDSAVEAIHAAAPFKVLPTSWGLDRVSFYLTFEVVEDRLVFHPM